MTRFGIVCVKVHRHADGWLPVVVGQHHLPAPPRLDGPLPQTETEALQRMAEAVERLKAG